MGELLKNVCNILHIIEKKCIFRTLSNLIVGNVINSVHKQMKPNKPKQVVKFYTTLPDKNLNQLYVVLEIKEGVEKQIAEIKPLNTGLSFSPSTVLLDDLEVVEVDTIDIIGYQVTINKSDYSQVVGKVVKVSEQEVILDLSKGVKGVETNVWLTIQDENGKEHTGTLFVN